MSECNCCACNGGGHRIQSEKPIELLVGYKGSDEKQVCDKCGGVFFNFEWSERCCLACSIKYHDKLTGGNKWIRTLN